MPTLDPKFIINLKGKQFVLLGGLLDLAHNGGLIGIETVLDKELSDPKEQSFVFQAIGRFRTDAGEATWSAYGDASPSNSQMRGATLRHAETRAIARMLRMATNVAMCSVEELGPDEETEGEQKRGPQRSAAAAPASRQARPRMDEPSMAPGKAQGVVGDVSEDEIARVVAEKYPPVGEAICAGRECGRELTMDELRDCAREKLSKPCCAEHLLAYLKKQADKAAKSS